MAKTQLASMRLGAPDILDDIRKHRPATPMIHITDGKTDRIRDVITAQHIIEDLHKQSLEDTLETFDFITFADQRFSQYLEKRNRIIIPGEDEEYREFIIEESVKSMNLQTEVYTTASYLELKKQAVIYPQTFNEATASMLVGHATNGTEWIPGTIEIDNYRTMTIENHTNPFSFLKRIANEFDAELRFHVETNGKKVTARYVDLLERRGRWRGREVEFGRDLENIKRTERTDNVYTALIGIGPEDDQGNRLEVLVEDEEALQRWGRRDRITGELKHLIGTYEPQSSRTDMTESELQQYTRTELNKRINETVEFEADIADLENVPGMENKKIRFGDTIKIKYTGFNPALYLEARVFEQERSIVDKSRKRVKLGDYTEYTEEEVQAIWNQLRHRIEQKIGTAELLEYAEPKRVESITEPENKDSIWVDTSQPERMIKVFENESWQAIGDVTEENTAKDTSNVDGTAAKTVKDNANAGKSAQEIINQNKDTWDRGTYFNPDGTLDVDRLYGLIPDDALASADQWNGQGTYIDENGVYTGTVLANQLVADELSAISANLGEITAGNIYGVNIAGAMITQEGDTGSIILDDDGFLFDTPNGSIEMNTKEGSEGYDNTASIIFSAKGSGYGTMEILQDQASSVIRTDSGLTVDALSVSVFSNLRTTDEIESGSQIYSYRSAVSGGIAAAHGIGAYVQDEVHVFTAHNTQGYLVIYPQRYADQDIFRIRSHHQKGDYSNDFRIDQNGYMRVPATYYNTTTNSPTVRVGSSAGLFTSTVSTRDAKLDIEDITKRVDPYKILDVQVRDWYDKGDVEKYSDVLHKRFKGDNCEADHVEWIKRIPGLVAEEVEEVGLDEFIDHDENGKLAGVLYDRLWTLLIPISRDHENKLKEHDERFGTIESRVDNLENQLQQLKGVA